MNFRMVALAACAAAGLAACASGSRNDGSPRDPIRALMAADALMFTSFDADGDISISQAEMEAGMAREFTRADSNGDGALAPIEFQNWSNLVLGGGQMGPYRLDFDRNVDNSITREEFETEIRARFTEYDNDGSGSVARSEMVRLLGQARPPSELRRPSIGIR